uniref:Uncharacterized protein n=1 Tax=viral metagenome TaxID=1070528 RepID=A0A6M3K163_9ZZZZ
MKMSFPKNCIIETHRPERVPEPKTLSKVLSIKAEPVDLAALYEKSGFRNMANLTRVENVKDCEIKEFYFFYCCSVWEDQKGDFCRDREGIQYRVSEAKEYERSVPVKILQKLANYELTGDMELLILTAVGKVDPLFVVKLPATRGDWTKCIILAEW